ncbi:MAG: hypothetical protein JXA94_03580, partial [Parachlamydiales bacterium]|nr:hypothetical protein [Parachlamydiales bacterium]
LIEKYYLEKSKYKNNKNYTEFFEDTKSKDFLKNSAYYNKEILVKIYDFDEGRDFSNRHPYPYISIEVLYDSQEDKKVSYSWEKAHRGYLTY